MADRLDPPSQPTGVATPVGVDEGDYLFGRPSSSVAKKTDAALRMSLARRSSRFSRSSCAMRCASAVDVPGRRPERSQRGSPTGAATPVRRPAPSRHGSLRRASRRSAGEPRAPSSPLAHAARPGTSAASAALQCLPCSILVSKVRSTRGSQADSEDRLSRRVGWHCQGSARAPHRSRQPIPAPPRRLVASAPHISSLPERFEGADPSRGRTPVPQRRLSGAPQTPRSSAAGCRERDGSTDTAPATRRGVATEHRAFSARRC